ncbi:MAG: hypothetical protein JRI25_07600 [Deltaproteobacteria bacterium]|nr:hypothetical protein [Deltaproteobacteria bacterium]
MGVPRALWLRAPSIAELLGSADPDRRRAAGRFWSAPPDEDLSGWVGRALPGWIVDRPDVVEWVTKRLTGDANALEAGDLEDELADRLLIRVGEGRPGVTWELVAAVGPHLDFDPPLLSVLLGKKGDEALEDLARRLGLPGDDPTDLRDVLHRALRSPDLYRRQLDPAPTRIQGHLMAHVDRLGEPLAPSPGGDAMRAMELGLLLPYPDDDGRDVHLPLEMALAVNVLRTEVFSDRQRLLLGELHDVAGATVHDALLPRSLVRQGAYHLIVEGDHARAGARLAMSAPSWDVTAIAARVLAAEDGGRLVDRGDDAIVRFVLSELVGPRNPLLPEVAAIFRVPDPLVEVVRLRGYLGAPPDDARGRAIVAAGHVGEILNRWLARLQWTVLVQLGNLPPQRPVARAEFARLVFVDALGVGAEHYSDLDGLDRHIPHALFWASASDLAATPPEHAIAEFLDQLVGQVLCPLGMASLVGDGVMVSEALLPLLQQVADNAPLPEPTRTAPAQFEVADDRLRVEVPDGESVIRTLAPLGRTGANVSAQDGGGWRVEVGPTVTDRVRVRATLLGWGVAKDPEAWAWVQRMHGAPSVETTEGATVLHAESEAALAWYLQEHGIDASRVERAGLGWAVIRSS